MPTTGRFAPAIHPGPPARAIDRPLVDPPPSRPTEEPSTYLPDAQAEGMFRPTVIGQDAPTSLTWPRERRVPRRRGPSNGSSSPLRRPALPCTVPEDGFVGRERELALLDAQLAQVRTSGARVVLIRGIAGIGKTALVREFLRRQRNLMVVRGSGDEGEATVSYALVDQLFAAVGLRSAALLAHTERVLRRGTGRRGSAGARGAQPPQRAGPDGGRDRRRELGRHRLAARTALRPAQAGHTPRADGAGGAVGRLPAARRARAARRGTLRGRPGRGPAGADRCPGSHHRRDRITCPGTDRAPPVRSHAG